MYSFYVDIIFSVHPTDYVDDKDDDDDKQNKMR